MRHRWSLAVAFASMLLASAAQGAVTLKVGDEPPPKLTWNTKLSDYRGKVVIVSFWASWCAPCRKELGVLAAIQKVATRDKVVVFSVNWQEDAQHFQDIKRFFKDQHLDLNLISDEGNYIGRQYGVTAIPHMVIIGRDGRIAAVHIGYGEGEIPLLASEINALWNSASEKQASAGTPRL
ncbi:MAG TPA: TlpA disulfide reductase family protein [Steroidobacteraceae bacterium]|nr:TlpA disulfide reductase family protein [Steroidobacteraceae bacterium]